MLLKNKKTGESYETTMPIVFNIKTNGGGEHTVSCESITELNEEWEDVPEEPERYWYIAHNGTVGCFEYDDGWQYGDFNWQERLKQIGNYFSSKEEAEKAVERLRAWKRLKDRGFRFDHIRSIDGVSIKHKDLDQYTIIAYADEDACDRESLDLLFGGEE